MIEAVGVDLAELCQQRGPLRALKRCADGVNCNSCKSLLYTVFTIPCGSTCPGKKSVRVQIAFFMKISSDLLGSNIGRG